MLNDFCEEFSLREESLGHVTRIGKRCFLTFSGQHAMIEKMRRNLFGAGVYLGEEKQRFEPSPALVELIAAKAGERNKAVIDEKAEWLFLCGRDIFNSAVKKPGEPTKSGFLLVQNTRGENLGLGRIPGKRQKNIAIQNILDRGFYLRRERMQ